METLFWVSFAIIAYVYAGYPLLLAAWARLAHRAPRRAAPAPAAWPAISIVVAARNEAGRLPARISNLLDIQYPGRREVIVVSDGSTDDTAEVVGAFGAPVRLIDVRAGGKPAALNAGIAAATGEIVVFADARQRFSENALVELVANFSDPTVGGVTGELVLDSERGQATGSSVGEGVGLYWRYEKWLRRNESLVWSTLGATGAIYALRRALWTPLPADALLDDVLAPMRAVLGGHRVVFEEKAQAFDRVSPDAATEWRRKVRTLAGNYQILGQEPRLLVPFLNPVWIQYVSHKIGRLIVPWALGGAFVASAVLSVDWWIYAVAFSVQCAFYVLAAAGGWVVHRKTRVMFTFVMMNYAAVAGLLALRRGREVWK